MTARIPARKIIWALDPFETDIPAPAHLIAALGGAAAHAKIEPVYVLGTDELGLPVPVAEDAMIRKLARVRLPGLQTPRVVTYDGGTVGAGVNALLKHAKANGADLIITGTHSRKGLPRLFLGSFAETLLLRSQIPVLVTHPKSSKDAGKRKGSIRKIVFPSDLGPGSRRSFHRALALARACHARLVLVHGIPHPVEPLIQSGTTLLGGGWLPSTEFITRAEEAARKTLKHWVNEALQAGVKATFTIQTAPLPVRDIVLSAARKADLIAMSAESGPMATALVGSVTRQVVREAQCPVWVVRA